jgi:uncharacterized membrane protein YfcA
VFGIAGFGTALVAGPILILFMPLSKIVPLLVLLDFVAAFGNLSRPVLGVALISAMALIQRQNVEVDRQTGAAGKRHASAAQ